MLFVSCGSEEKIKVENKPVKKKEDVQKATLNTLREILFQNPNDSILVYEGDTLLTLPYFEKIKGDSILKFLYRGKLTAIGDSILFHIVNARNYGLYPEDYHCSKILHLLDTMFNKKDSVYYSGFIAQAELLLTDAYLLFGGHLNKGRFMKDTILREWNPAKLDTNWWRILKFGLDSMKPKIAFDLLEPKHEGYHFLKMAFRKYIDDNVNVNWDSIPFASYPDPDTTGLLKEALKERLINTGDYNDSLKKNDSIKLAWALKKFQKRMNLAPDGKLGKFTKQALQLDKEKTIRQMEMALERWRWEPEKYPERYAIINIPSARMKVWEYYKKKKIDTLVLESVVVVGKPETPTPLLESKINYIQIYPYWNVPYTIAWKEILPMVQRDTGYLRRKNFEVIGANNTVITDIGKLNWKKYNKEYLPIRFRQRIGDDNSLGICKFNFRNKYGVYLHDTNSKRYFKTFYRFQSHGCIRLDKYYELARFLIREDTLDIPYDTLDAYLARPIQQKIMLGRKQQLPIYVRYFTALTDSLNELQLYLDIYRRDEEMMKKIYK